MTYLLDTHTLIWFITNDKNLPTQTKLHIEDSSSKCYVSVASLWEIAIKYSLGKLELNEKLERVFEIISESGFEILPITSNHILYFASLPFHHRDPFDRLLIAQSNIEELTIITKDELFHKYKVKSVWA